MSGRLMFVVAASAFAVDAAAFESQIWPGTLPASSTTISMTSPLTAGGAPDIVGGWVRINYALSIDCSPPRACYANSQAVYSYAYCSTRAIREIQRISMDLNGSVVAETGERPPYIPTRGSVDRAVVRLLCEAAGFWTPLPWRGLDGGSDADD